MSKLDKHISELLYDHECVIVPDLGGFLTSYAPARIHPTRHTVTAPSKKIAFNVFLKHNDGLLANYVVQAESVTYPEALREIQSYVEVCNSELSAGKKFVIEQVGVLTRDAETNLQFEPFKNLNYLKDSFGLSTVQFMPVVHSDFEEEVEKQLRDFISLRPSQAQPRPGIPRKKIRLNSLNTILLTGSVLWFCLNLYIVSPDNVSLASLNPFSVSADKHPVTQPAASAPEIYTQPSVAKPETVYVKTTAPVEVAAPVSSPAQAKQAANKDVQASTHNYFIIAGAFSSASNAARKEMELKAAGFSNAHIIENEQGLKMVYYSSFATRQEAFEELKRMHAQHQEGWILSR